MPDPKVEVYEVYVSHRGPSEVLNLSLQALSNLRVKIENGPAKHPYSTRVRCLLWFANLVLTPGLTGRRKLAGTYCRGKSYLPHVHV